MSNHVHFVVHIDKIKNLGWSIGEVVERWHQRNKQDSHQNICLGYFLWVS
jgi:hypothetical protein